MTGAAAIVAACKAPAPSAQPATLSKTQAKAEDSSPRKQQTNTLRPRVKMETRLGEIILELNAEEAPATVLNFVQCVQERYYDGTIFHRVLRDSMIQGGGYTPDLKPKHLVNLAVPEFWQSELINLRGTIAMVRGQDKSGKGSAQFLINVADNQVPGAVHSQGTHIVFGRVVAGLDTVDRVCNTPAETHPAYAAGRSAVVPVEPVVIDSVRLLAPFDPEPVRALVAAARAEADNALNRLIDEFAKRAGSEVVTTDSGLRYVDFVVGAGASPLPTDTVEFHYHGTLVDGSEFESTLATKPSARKVERLIPGLREGLLTMNEGGKRTLIIPPQLAFGEGGIPGHVPPDATLIFEIELLEIK